MKTTRWARFCAAVLLPAATAAAAAPMGCLIEPERVTDVGSPVIGVIERIDVERGQTVRRGQVLALLRADVERANLGAASSRADSDADVKSAAASAAFNRERLLRTEDLFRQHFVSQQALDQARAEAQMAEQKLAQAREQRQVSQHERTLAAAQLSQRVIRSPMDGVVAERWLSAGERVDDKPLLRIARVDPLRVQLVVPVALYGQVQAGGRASVQPDLPGAAAVAARVTMVDRVVDPASNTFRVQLELPNADAALPAGLRCRAEFVAEAAPGASLSAGGGAAVGSAAGGASTAPVPPAVRSVPPAQPPVTVPQAAPAGAAPPPRSAPRPAGLALALSWALPPAAAGSTARPTGRSPVLAAAGGPLAIDPPAAGAAAGGSLTMTASAVVPPPQPAPPQPQPQRQPQPNGAANRLAAAADRSSR